MENPLDGNKKQLYFTDKDIFTKIWTSPRKVFRFINDTQYDKYVKVLLVLAGISRAFDRASMKDMGDNMSLLSIIGFSVLVGGLLGWISYYIYAALVSWTGKWLKGQGNTSSILRILSYAMTPAIFSLIFLIPQIGIYGNEMFKSDGDIISAGLIANIFVYSSIIIELILGIWTMVLCIIGISEVQKISIGKSILNLFLPIIVILIPIILFALLFRLF
jgi:hypothetical protein